MRELLDAADAYDESVARRLGVSRTDVRCIDVLARKGTMAAGAVADVTGLTSGAVTFLVDRLEAAGVVRRRRDPEDRRRVLVELVPGAAQRSLDVHRPMIEDMRAVVKRHSTEELAVIRDFLQGVKDVYERRTPTD
jgi:DNA-binding MarR family transcriptional regulator